MSLFSSSSLKFLFPTSYSQIRPHDVLALCFGWRFLSNTSLFRKLSDKMLSLASSLSERLIPLVYYGVVPDFLIRAGIRLQLRDHLAILHTTDTELELENKLAIVRELREMPIAIETDLANEQHYEVPAEFYNMCLGPCKKYSCGLWESPSISLQASEEAMLDLYCDRAQLNDGLKIVDLGCGWGSLTLHLAKKYPNAKITSISNSNSQREYILATAKQRGLNVDNINVITCNVADDKGALDVVKENDVVLTIEMFEHMKNYKDLLHKIHGFLNEKGRLFVHIFSHKDYTYHFEEGWMSDNFFTGGTMPSDDLLLYFSQDFSIMNHWRVNGTHYELTSNAWLKLMDDNWKSGKLQSVLAEAYGKGNERQWYVNWRLFYMACAELFGLDGGNEWIVTHYLFEKR